jgi:hypothetical protein
VGGIGSSTVNFPLPSLLCMARGGWFHVAAMTGRLKRISIRGGHFRRPREAKLTAAAVRRDCIGRARWLGRFRRFLETPPPVGVNVGHPSCNVIIVVMPMEKAISTYVHLRCGSAFKTSFRIDYDSFLESYTSVIKTGLLLIVDATQLTC